VTLSLPTDIELVEAAAATYDPAAVPFYDDFTNAIRIFQTTRADGLNIISAEGTKNPAGWAIDFCALGIEDHAGTNHPSLGFVHAGFLVSALLAMPKIQSVTTKGPFAISGHSLGAAMALLLGGLLIDNGTPPVKIGAFAPPRVGGEQFVKVATSVPFCAYAYGNDPVPRVPFRIMPLFPYMQVGMTDIGTPRLNEFSCHAIQNYVVGVKEKQT
jgi:predicted lipase